MLAADVVLGGIAPPMVSPGGPTGSISGTVLAGPATAECVAHEHAVGLAAVRLQLLDASGTFLEETTTDPQGDYEFADLLPGDYAVRRLPMPGEALADPQQLDAIGVLAGEALNDLDFCHSDSMLNAADAEPAALASVLSVVFRDAPRSAPVVSGGPISVVEVNADQQQLPLLDSTRPVEFFGGSSRELKSPPRIKAWEDIQLDDWPIDDGFLTISFMNMTSTQSVGLATLDSIYGDEAELDAAWAERYTSECWDGSPCDEGIHLEEILGLLPNGSQSPEDVADEARSVPQVASRQEASATQ